MFQGLFNYDNPIWRAVGRIGDLIFLNILWMLCCIPIVTAGAATTALYYCILKMLRDEDSGLLKMFFHSFRQNFRQGTILWLLLLPIGVLLGADFWFFGRMFRDSDGMRMALQGLTAALLLLWVFIMLYVFPLLSHFENTVKGTLSNAALMSLRHLGSTLAMLVSDLIFVGIFYGSMFFMPGLSAFLFLVGFSAIAGLNATMLSHIFRRYEPEELRDGQELRPILEDVTLDPTEPAEKTGGLHFRNILFDVDGTLWDAAEQVAEAWNSTMDTYPETAGRNVTVEEIYSYMGHTMDEIADLMLAEVPQPLRGKIMEECMDGENSWLYDHSGRFYPGIRETMETLNREGRRLYIVSNCQDGYIQTLLHCGGLEGLVRDFECFGRTGKPKGDNIRLLMERHHLRREESVYVGDTAMDETAAGEAGIPIIYAAYGFGHVEKPLGVLPELSMLPEILKKMEK